MLKESTTLKYEDTIPCIAKAGLRQICEFNVRETTATVPFTMYWDNGDITEGEYRGVRYSEGTSTTRQECLNELSGCKIADNPNNKPEIVKENVRPKEGIKEIRGEIMVSLLRKESGSEIESTKFSTI